MAVIGERRRGAPPYAHEGFVNSIHSKSRVHYEPMIVFEFNDDGRETDYVDSTMLESLAIGIYLP